MKAIIITDRQRLNAVARMHRQIDAAIKGEPMPTDEQRAATLMLAWVDMWINPDPFQRALSRDCVTGQFRQMRAWLRYTIAHARLNFYVWRKSL